MDRQLKRYLIIAALVAGLLASLDIAGRRGWINANQSGSVPVGLYIKASPDGAAYVSFCLTKRHSVFAFYARYCSPDNPDGKRIIKRIVERRADGSLVVQGDIEFAIDSKVLGSIDPYQIRGFWNALLVLARISTGAHHHV